jgi:hypothetical protein
MLYNLQLKGGEIAMRSISIILIIGFMLMFGCGDLLAAEEGGVKKVDVVTGQVLLGYVAYVAGLAVGSYVVVNSAGWTSNPGSILNCTLCQAVFVGSIFGSLASTATVYEVGKLAGYKGKFWPTLWGGSVGPIGAFASSVAYHQLHSDYGWALCFLGGAILTPPLETWAYHKSDTDSPAAIHIESSNIQFSAPKMQLRVTQLPDGRIKIDQVMHLVSVRF